MTVCRSLLWHIVEFMGCKTLSESTAQRSENAVVHLRMQSSIVLGEVRSAPSPAVRESGIVVADSDRITEWSGLEGISVGHLVQPPCPSRVTQSRLHSTASGRVWNISREGDSTASLGSLFQGSITLRGKKFFLLLRRKQPWCSASSRVERLGRCL